MGTLGFGTRRKPREGGHPAPSIGTPSQDLAMDHGPWHGCENPRHKL
jgi:hypothetical protein